MQVVVLGLALSDDRQLLSKHARSESLDVANSRWPRRNEYFQKLRVGIGNTLGKRSKVDRIERDAVLAQDGASERRELRNECFLDGVAGSKISDRSVAPRFA